MFCGGCGATVNENDGAGELSDTMVKFFDLANTLLMSPTSTASMWYRLLFGKLGSQTSAPPSTLLTALIIANDPCMNHG